MFLLSCVRLVFSILWIINSLETSQWLETKKVLRIKQGLLEGRTTISRNGREYYEFLGIPYGKIPIRFQPSVQGDGWEGVKAATEFGPMCIQYIFREDKIIGQEDCLVLNIYTAKINDDEAKLPVMVFIHGGAYLFGRGDSYGAKYFMDEDIVLVTINYRLGAFGFLNAEEVEAGGNMGLKDQVLALKWVQENIESFNGDKNKVTIFGESSGGVSVSLLLLSPLAKDLFQRAISQSGTALTPLGFTDDPVNQAVKLANAVGCPTKNSKLMIDCLTKIDARLIIDKSKQRDPLLWERDNIIEFLPSIERYKDRSSSEKFLQDHPYNILKEGHFNKIPYILGVNSHEGLVGNAAPILYNEDFRKRFNNEWDILAPLTFEYKNKVERRKRKEISTLIKHFYFGDGEIGLESLEGLTDLFTDRWLLHSTKLFAHLYSQHAPTYLYNFTKRGTASFLDALQIPYTNPSAKFPTHVDELQYLFDGISGIHLYPFIDRLSLQYHFSRNFIKLWTSFAANGEPLKLWSNASEKWLPIAGNKGTGNEFHPLWFRIDIDARMMAEDESVTRRFHFWETLPLKENKNLDLLRKLNDEL